MKASGGRGGGGRVGVRGSLNRPRRGYDRRGSEWVEEGGQGEGAGGGGEGSGGNGGIVAGR